MANEPVAIGKKASLSPKDDASQRIGSLVRNLGSASRLVAFPALDTVLVNQTLLVIPWGIKGIGRQYRLRDIGGREWRRLAGDLRLDPATFLRWVVELADRLPDDAASVRERMLSDGLEHRIIAHLAKRVSEHAARCSKLLEGEIATGSHVAYKAVPPDGFVDPNILMLCSSGDHGDES